MEAKTIKSTFVINPQTLRKYQRNGVYFSQPRLVAFYDYNYGKITNSKRINYFRNLKTNQYPLDLNADFEKFIPRKSQMYSRYIDISLKYVMDSDALNDIENIDKTKIITRRGTFVKIMESFYNKNFGDITIFVSRYNGNLYMVTKEEDESLKELTKANVHHRRLQKLLFSESPNNPKNIEGACDENIELVGVHRSNFGKFDVIYSGEIQGINTDKEVKDFNDFNELNNYRYVFTKQMWKSIKHKENKYIKYWLQSYLANVSDIYIGYKDEDGFIHEPIEYIKASDLPKNQFWKPSMCTGFLYEFLQYVEREMSSIDCLDTVFTFQYNAKQNTFKCESLKGQSDRTFINKNYKDYCKNV